MLEAVLLLEGVLELGELGVPVEIGRLLLVAGVPELLGGVLFAGVDLGYRLWLH